MLSTLKLKWQSVPANDRQIYMLLAIIIGISFIYAFLWLPSIHARVSLEREIVEKEYQLKKMQAQAVQVQALQNAVKLSHSNVQGFRNALEDSAKLYGMTSSISKIQLSEKGAVNVGLPKVNFDNWIRWVNALQTEHQIRLLSAHIAVLGNSNMVQVDATFSPQ